jgi:type II secretory pathway component HofQ
VLIEARIVEADDKFSKNLGAKLGSRICVAYAVVMQDIPSVEISASL